LGNSQKKNVPTINNSLKGENVFSLFFPKEEKEALNTWVLWPYKNRSILSRPTKETQRLVKKRWFFKMSCVKPHAEGGVILSSLT